MNAIHHLRLSLNTFMQTYRTVRRFVSLAALWRSLSPHRVIGRRKTVNGSTAAEAKSGAKMRRLRSDDSGEPEDCRRPTRRTKRTKMSFSSIRVARVSCARKESISKVPQIRETGCDIYGPEFGTVSRPDLVAAARKRATRLLTFF